MHVTTTSFAENAPIPTRYAELSAGGENVSPQLAWSDAPEGTQSFAITCYDPDAPTGSGWWHWIGYDIPTTIESIDEGSEFPGQLWDNDYGYANYGGPCPPAGPAHRYVFTVHALDCEQLPVGPGVTQAAVRFTILAHALDSASVTGTFALPDSASL